MESEVRDEHSALVARIKEEQRASERARQAWKWYCDAEGGGIRDPNKQSASFLQSFVFAFGEGRIAPASVCQHDKLVQVSTAERALGARQIKLRMPASEEGIMKEVISTNVYGFLPGRTCVLQAQDVVLDVGAHVGIASTLALCTKDVKVVCVEPHPETFEILRKNMSEHGENVTLVNQAVAETEGVRPLYVHCGTNSPSRLYFSSLFDSRRHDDEPLAVQCTTLQELMDAHKPTVVKIDAEGAERFLSTVDDFGGVRLIVAEWDWSHNRHRSLWQRVETHLREKGFSVHVRGHMPSFDEESGHAVLYSARGKKRGSTGMIFTAVVRQLRAATVLQPQALTVPPRVASDGCPVGALLCDVRHVRRVFDACRPRALLQQKGAVPHEGRLALHLNLDGAALLCAGCAPPEVQALLDEGCVTLVPGLRRGATSQAYRGPIRGHRRTPAAPPRFTFIELFAGIGGFRRGLEQLGGRCVFASEIDGDCQEAYAENFGGAELFGDITAIHAKDIPEHDILTAGFPCQAFSRRGERLGWADRRGGLFLEIPRVLQERRPAGFILENVWNLQFLEGGQWDKDPSACTFGKVFEYVLDSLQKVGYMVQSKVLHARGWVPQDRERVYIVGFRDDLAEAASETFKWPEPVGGGTVGSVLEQAHSPEVRRCELTESQWAAVQRSSTWKSGGERLRFVDSDGVASTLTSSYKASFANVAQLVGPEHTGLQRPRFFTLRECARLMGFGEDHALGNAECPNRAYHQLGNAVCPPVVHAVASNLVRSLGFLQAEEAADLNQLFGWPDTWEQEQSKKIVRDAGDLHGQLVEPPAVELQEAKAEGLEQEQEDREGEMEAERGTEQRKQEDADVRQYLTTPGAQPALREQLEAFGVEQLQARLEEFGVPVRQPRQEEFVRGFKAARKEELLDVLCAEYAARFESQPRTVVEDVGIPLPAEAVKLLLAALRMMRWTENVRPAVHATGYVVLKQPTAMHVPSQWREGDPRTVRRRVWDLATALLRSASPKAARFDFTAIAVSKNFRGSPHIDKNDISVQYALSLGDFDDEGGKLCVEESPFVVRAFTTRSRLVCFDGRFPHWVSGYVGERYSIIFYRSCGTEEASVQAVHDV